MERIKKYQYIKNFVQDDEVIEELLNYTKSNFKCNSNVSDFIKDEPYIEAWDFYKKESLSNGVFETLKKYIVQFNFPIEENISKTESYRNTTLKGKKEFPTQGLKLNNPKGIELDVYESGFVGKVPVLTVPDSDDFVSIISALCYKNEPTNVSKSMGAIFISGINNWHRIEKQKQYWQNKEPFESWGSIFKSRIVPNPESYKDKLIVLSTKSYSNVSANTIGVSKEFWKETSVGIRKAHECAHVFTQKYYGSISKNIYDELVADYTGIVSSRKKFDKDWMLHFFGLENYPSYREGGRFQNYLDENLSEKAISLLRDFTVKAIDNIAEFDKTLGSIQSSNDFLNRIKSLCETDFLSMAMENGKENLLRSYHKHTEEELIE